MRDRRFSALRLGLRFGALLLLFVLPVPAQTSSVLKQVRSGNYAPHHSPADGEIRIVDWNIDRGTRLEEVTKAIAAQKPAVCVLQEVDRNASRSRRVDVADELARRLRMNYVFAAAFEELSQGTAESPAWQGQATLSAFPIGQTRVLRYRRQTGFWAPQPWLPGRVALLQRRSGGRIGLISEIDVSGRIVVVYNLHLESRGPGAARFAQLRETLADARRYSGDTPVVIAGDLNTKYAASRFTRLLAGDGFVDCFGGHSGRTHRIVGRLDWIFVRGAIGCTSAAVDRSAPGSDHYPLTAVLQLRGAR